MLARPCSPSAPLIKPIIHPSALLPSLTPAILPHIYLNLLSREENFFSLHLKSVKFLLVCRRNCICHCRKASAIARKHLLIDQCACRSSHRQLSKSKTLPQLCAFGTSISNYLYWITSIATVHLFTTFPLLLVFQNFYRAIILRDHLEGSITQHAFTNTVHCCL